MADPMNDDLVGRLEAAEAGSRELDALIEDVFDPLEPDEFGQSSHAEFTDNPHFEDEVGYYTTSLDAALALAERVHPGFHAALYTSDGTMQRQATISVPTRRDGPFDARAATIPLALCIAILKARPSAGTGSHEGEGG